LRKIDGAPKGALQVFLFEGLVSLLEKHQEREKKPHYGKGENKETSRHLFPTKEEFVFLYFVFFFGK
jgi:hypothetical protein